MAAVLYDRAFNYLNRKDPGDEELATKDAKEIVDNFKEHRLFPYANDLLANLYAPATKYMNRKRKAISWPLWNPPKSWATSAPPRKPCTTCSSMHQRTLSP